MESEDYRLTKWKGLDNWQCKHCPFATVEGLGVMMAHLGVHVSAMSKGFGMADGVDPEEPDEEE